MSVNVNVNVNVNDYIVLLLQTVYANIPTRQINLGRCEDFAMDLTEQFPDGYSAWGDEWEDMFGEFHEPDAHCFFVHEGLYYDCECPTGVDTPVKLPFYRRQEAYIRAARANARRSKINPFLTVNGEAAFCP